MWVLARWLIVQSLTFLHIFALKMCKVDYFSSYIFIKCQSDIENIVNPFGHSIDSITCKSNNSGFFIQQRK